jgi:hypothetical protein
LIAAIMACLVSTGCTMCPDPFDYAGPVPNGSVSQNDFAARSNGILPVRATPLPWPPLVDTSPRTPTPADELLEGEAATLATALEAPCDLESEEITILEASLTEPVAADADQGGVSEEPSADESASADTGAKPFGQRTDSRVQWEAYARRHMPAPRLDASPDAPDAVILESRLPRDVPSVLLR